MENCISGPWPAVQIDEDLAGMRVNGFPLQGYLEFKARAISAKEVQIVITCKGVTHARFICEM